MRDPRISISSAAGKDVEAEVEDLILSLRDDLWDECETPDELVGRIEHALIFGRGEGPTNIHLHKSQITPYITAEMGKRFPPVKPEGEPGGLGFLEEPAEELGR